MQGDVSLHPFVFCAHITKAINSSTTTNGARGGIYWATSEDAARGALARTYLDDGFTVQILEVQPVDGDGLARLAAYHAALEKIGAQNGGEHG